MDIEQKIDKLASELLNVFSVSLNDSSEIVKGLWLFRFNEDINCLEYWSIILTKVNSIEDTTKQLIKRVQIAKGEGSIGYAVLNEEITVIENTAEDPRGVVSVEDEKIGQKSAVCYPIFTEENGRKQLICVLDFFGEGFEQSRKDTYKTIVDKIDSENKEKLFLLNELSAYSRLQNLLLDNEKQTIDTAIDVHKLADKYINEILPTTLTSFNENNGRSNEIAINTQYFIRIIKEEIEWCSFQSDNSSCSNCIVESLLSFKCLFNSQAETGHQSIDDIPGYRVIYKLIDDTESGGIINPFKNELKKFVADKKLKKLSDKIKDELIGILISGLLSDNSEVGHRQTGFVSLIESYKLDYEYLQIDCVNESQLEYLLVFKEEDGFVWNPAENNDILTYKAELRKPAVIRAFYAGLQSKDNQLKYPAAINPDLKVNYDDEKTSIQVGNVKWQWQSGAKRKKVISIYLNEKKVSDDLKILFKDSISTKLSSISDEQHFSHSCTVLDNYNFDIFSRSEINEIQEKSITTYLNHICGLFQSTKEKSNALRYAHKSAMTAIMARNFSHNIGSHVLSAVRENYIKNNPEQVSDFHAYLQKRMDLIARMVGGQYTSGEPMFFVGDVLNGFFKQNLLLNHLVKDQGGYEKKFIEFKVYLPESQPLTFSYSENDPVKDKNKKWIYKPTNGASTQQYNDFLVSIPDGEIGCQAFYLFLESMMRNSAKYGLNKTSQFQITIKLENLKNKEDHYKISICDNLSLCNSTQVEQATNVAETMRGKLDDEIIDPSSGQLDVKSFGIAEMSAACEFLMEPFGEDYPAHEDIDKNKKYPLWVECPGLEECHKEETKDFECKEASCCNHLTYTFNLMKPQMVAIVGKNDVSDNKKYGIKGFTSLEDLKSQKGAYQFVLIYVNNDNRDSIISDIQTDHHLLPFRLIQVGNGFELPEGVPKRRLITCPPEEICIENIKMDDGARRLIISTYETWIRNRWLKKMKCVNLVLAFNRDDNDAIFDKYEKIDGIKILPDKVKWSVFRTNGDNEPDLKHGGVGCSCYLIYDNHSCFAKADRLLTNPKTLFHHNTADENKKIFETLASPSSQQNFTFQYFLLGFLEAALTKVIIIDERVAESCIGKHGNIDHLIALDKCLCHPLFCVEGKPLNKQVEQKIDSINENGNLKRLWGLLQGRAVQNNNNKSVQDADFIVVHYGLMETINKLQNTEELYSLAPTVVIASGRGSGTIKKDKTNNNNVHELPFIEASILKENTYPSISKYHLVRALMSVKGGV